LLWRIPIQLPSQHEALVYCMIFSSRGGVLEF
jgi:hypothetical protein